MTSVSSSQVDSRPYSSSRRVGNFVCTAGVAGYHLDHTLDESFERQVHVTFGNLVDTLKSSGATLVGVMSVDVFIVRPDDYDEMNRLYRSYFVEDPLPVRTTVTVGLRPGALFEVKAMAVVQVGTE